MTTLDIKGSVPVRKKIVPQNEGDIFVVGIIFHPSRRIFLKGSYKFPLIKFLGAPEMF